MRVREVSGGALHLRKRIVIAIGNSVCLRGLAVPAFGFGAALAASCTLLLLPSTVTIVGLCTNGVGGGVGAEGVRGLRVKGVRVSRGGRREKQRRVQVRIGRKWLSQMET